MTQLISTTITTAVTATTSTPVTIKAWNGDPVDSLLIDVNFDYGSGGTTAEFWVQTSFDDEVTWVDVVNVTATTADVRRIASLQGQSANTSLVVVEDGGATLNGAALSGILGTKWRVKMTTTGTYATSTTITVNAYPR